MEHKRETMTKAQRYAEVRRHIVATLGKERHPITIMATVTAILRQTFTHFYWVGFLLVEGNEMVAGHFKAHQHASACHSTAVVCTALVTAE